MMPTGPAPGGPTFPTGAAQDLAATLRQAASDLETAATERVTAGDGLPEFQGAFADQYRGDLGTYATNTSGICELLRGAAGRLEDAIDEYVQNRQIWQDIGQPI